jgi:opacity protein-like surface antigen
MRRILLSLLSVTATSGFAADNSLFQEFDNQVSIGFGINQNSSGYGTTNTIQPNSWVISTSNVLNFEVEHLMNNGIWIDVNANMAFGSGPVSQVPISGSNGGTYQSSDYGMNAKVGYAFSGLAVKHLQLTPYVTVGLNNVASSIQYAPSSNVISNNFSYLGGIGGRAEYRINHIFMIYADQMIGYNWDQSGPQNGIMPQNTVQFTSTLGAKFNVVKNLQLGIEGYYSDYQPQASNYTSNGFMAQPQWAFGGLVSVGYTY